MWSPPPRRPLRQQVREAGGFYHWFNATLIRIAGPPQVGARPQPQCANCGAKKQDHVLIEEGLSCPGS